MFTLHKTSTGVDIFFSLIFSYFCFFVAAWNTKQKINCLPYAHCRSLGFDSHLEKENLLYSKPSILAPGLTQSAFPRVTQARV
jgi:hypothetical protein